MVEPTRLREVSWQELFPWLRIVSALRLAISPSLLALGAIGIVATTAGWSVIGKIYSQSDNATVQSIVRNVSAWPWESPPAAVDLPERVRDVYSGPFFAAWSELSQFFKDLFAWNISILPFTLILLLALWALLVWSLFGAAITRIAAVGLARGDRPGFRAGLAHGIRRWPLYFGAPAIPLVGAFLVAIPVIVLGLLMQLDFFVLVGGILWPLVILCGLIMALLLLGLVVGWPLMWATISVEATDPFDALSRSYSYAFQRPIRYLFYLLVAAVLGLLGWYVVSWFARWIILFSFWGISWGATVDRTTEIIAEASYAVSPDVNPHDWSMFTTGGNLIGFWHACIWTLAIGFVYSYFWSAMTAIYYLLRRDEDGTELTEVTYEEPGEPRGLPPLSTDAMGVPAVSDVPPASAPARPAPPEPPVTPAGP